MQTNTSRERNRWCWENSANLASPCQWARDMKGASRSMHLYYIYIYIMCIYIYIYYVCVCVSACVCAVYTHDFSSLSLSLSLSLSFSLSLSPSLSLSLSLSLSAISICICITLGVKPPIPTSSLSDKGFRSNNSWSCLPRQRRNRPRLAENSWEKTAADKSPKAWPWSDSLSLSLSSSVVLQ